jgi:hypothetical protein
VRKTDAAKADAMVQERAAGNALLRAQGIKVKDSAAQLKKSMKRDSKTKEKSAVAWKGRAKELSQSMKKRQKERTANLTARMTKGKAKTSKDKAKRAGFQSEKAAKGKFIN